jgi:hypothetical protein
MATVYSRAGTRKLQCSYYDETGKRKQIATPYDVGDEAKAQRFADEIERQAKRATDAETGALTVRLYAKQWLKARRDRGMDSVDEDEARLKKYTFPMLGALPMSDVRPRHLRELVLSLKTKIGPAKEHSRRAPCGTSSQDFTRCSPTRSLTN